MRKRVCVCVREREGEREKNKKKKGISAKHSDGSTEERERQGEDR